jgi:hypothetical protein
MVEYMKSADDFPFDVEDVENEIHTVLSWFGIIEYFNADELAILKEDLRQMALKQEYREMTRSSHVHFDNMPDRAFWGIR